MRVLWIFAHPETRSLSGALRDEGLRALLEADAGPDADAKETGPEGEDPGDDPSPRS